jgi:hypothetical protein
MLVPGPVPLRAQPVCTPGAQREQSCAINSDAPVAAVMRKGDSLHVYHFIVPAGPVTARLWLFGLPPGDSNDLDLDVTVQSEDKFGHGLSVLGGIGQSSGPEAVEVALDKGGYYVYVSYWGGTQPLQNDVSYTLRLELVAEPPPPPASRPVTWPDQFRCAYSAGFLTLHDAMPDIVGRCLENATFDPVSGTATQFSSGGQLTWQKDLDLTRFSDGTRTWVSTPAGPLARLNAEAPLPPETAAPARRANPVAPASFFVDFGNEAAEARFNLVGWAWTDRAGWCPDEKRVEWQCSFDSPSGDRTKRYQGLRGDSSLTFTPVDPGWPYRLSAEVEDGACTDSFQILANGVLVFAYRAAQRSAFNFTDPAIHAHVVTLPPWVLTTKTLTVTFRNTATDTCGRAGVYNARLERLDASTGW